MKWISFLLVFVLANSVFSQVGVRTIKSYMRGGIQLKGLPVLLSGKDTLNAVYLGDIEGAVTAYFITDTTSASVVGSNQSDSCLSVYLQLKHNKPGAVWSEYALKGTSTYTKLDTVARSIVNRSSISGFYLPLGNEVEYAPNDSMRFILEIGTSDSLYLKDLRFIGF